MRKIQCWSWSYSPALPDLLCCRRTTLWYDATRHTHVQFSDPSPFPLPLRLHFQQVGECVSQALAGEQSRAAGEGESEQGEKKKKRGKKDTRCERELLSSICSLHGQALVAQGAGKMVAARAAMEAFLQSAKLVLLHLT